MIYFVQADRGPIKIGFTSNWASRFRTLRYGTSNKLKQLLVIDGDRSLESELLKRFRPIRIRGEWFKADPSLLSFIESMKPFALQFESKEKPDRHELHNELHKKQHQQARTLVSQALTELGNEQVAVMLGLALKSVKAIEKDLAAGWHLSDGNVKRILQVWNGKRPRKRSRTPFHMERVAKHEVVDLVGLAMLRAAL